MDNEIHDKIKNEISNEIYDKIDNEIKNRIDYRR